MSKLDCRNALLRDLTGKTVSLLQRVQNAAGRVAISFSSSNAITNSMFDEPCNAIAVCHELGPRGVAVA